MSDFVDYNKRDVSLPAGCKDLIDVLKRQKAAPQSEVYRVSVEQGNDSSGMTLGGSSLVTLGGVPDCLDQFLKVMQPHMFFQVSALNVALSLAFERCRNDGWAIFGVLGNNPKKDALDSFAAIYGLELVTIREIPPHVYGCRSVALEPSRIKLAVLDWFEKVGGAPHDAQVEFRYRTKPEPPRNAPATP